MRDRSDVTLLGARNSANNQRPRLPNAHQRIGRSSVEPGARCGIA
jgi:hypothetical protein